MATIMPTGAVDAPLGGRAVSGSGWVNVPGGVAVLLPNVGLLGGYGDADPSGDVAGPR